MVKKNFSKGLDALLTPTTKPSPDEDKTSSSPVSKLNRLSATGEDSKIIFRLPVEVKIKLDIYCAQNRITKQDFISDLIIKSLDV